jgi:hypothetical protein
MYIVPNIIAGLLSAGRMILCEVVGAGGLQGQLKWPQVLWRGSVDMFYQLPGPRSPDAGRMAGY